MPEWANPIFMFPFLAAQLLGAGRVRPSEARTSSEDIDIAGLVIRMLGPDNCKLIQLGAEVVVPIVSSAAQGTLTKYL